MNAQEITFGVEIECLFPADNAPPSGRPHAGIQVAVLPDGWNAQHDGSLRPKAGFVGVEIVSPALKGQAGVAQIKTVCDWLRSKGVKVNRTCGLHVHIGFNKADVVNLQKLVGVVANFEKAIYASTGTKSRERGCFCQSIQASVAHQSGELADVRRYYVLNVVSPHPTVEFRPFAGTTDFIKIVASVAICVGLVEKSLKIGKKPGWIAKTPVESSPISRGGEGLTALNRLFYWLGWTKGREKYAFGAIDGMPKIKTLKNKLVELARKYDGNDNVTTPAETATAPAPV